MVGRSVVGSCSLGLMAWAVMGCGAALPAAGTAVVHVETVTPVVAPKKDESAPKDEKDDGEESGGLTLVGTLEDESEQYGIIGLLNAGAGLGSGALGGILGGVPGGMIGGPGSGFGSGGLGLSGVGVGAGGSGGAMGLGSIGTIGRGSGGGSSSIGGYGGSGSTAGSVTVGGGVMIDLGDSSTLGLSLEQASSVLRGRVTRLRDCYQTSLDKSPGRGGSVGLRLVVGRGGRVDHVLVFSSDLGDAEMSACLVKALKESYAGSPAGGSFGVIETVVSFRKAPRP